MIGVAAIHPGEARTFTLQVEVRPSEVRHTRLRRTVSRPTAGSKRRQHHNRPNPARSSRLRLHSRRFAQSRDPILINRAAFSPAKPRRALTTRLASGGRLHDRELAAQTGMTANTFLQNVVRARRSMADCLEGKGVRLSGARA